MTKVGDPIMLADGSWGFISMVTEGIIEVEPFWRARPHKRVVVIGVDRDLSEITEEDEL